MQGIGAGFGDHVHVGARVTAIARVERGGLNFEFLQGVRIGDADAGVDTGVRRDTGAGEIGDRHAVHLIIVLIDIGAVHADILRAFAEVRRVVYADVRSGGKAQDLRVIARGERQVRHRARAHRGAERGTGGFEGFRAGLHRHLL